MLPACLNHSTITLIAIGFRFHHFYTLTFASQGMLQITSDVATSVEILMLLWKHECSRVIADRFVGKQDCEWFDKSMKQVRTLPQSTCILYV